jgi:hypothetical protein
VTEHLGGKKPKVKMQKGPVMAPLERKQKWEYKRKAKLLKKRMHEMKTKPNNISSGCGREKKQK